MDDIGILVYLVGLVAYYIYRAYKKASKSKNDKGPQPQQPHQPQQQPARQKTTKRYRPKPQPAPLPQDIKPEPKREINIDDMFREMFDIPKIEPVQEIEDVIEDKIEMPPEVITTTSLTKKKEYTPSIKFDEATLLVGSTGKRRKKNKLKFNLKKAIIYNAVLERPYK